MASRPQKPTNLGNIWPYIVSLIVIFAAVFAYCWRFVSAPPIQDDLDYLGLPPWTPQQGLAYCNPAWGWYFRPVFNNYILFVITIFHKDWRAVHLAGIAVAGFTVWMLWLLAYRLKSWPAATLAAAIFLYTPRKDEAIYWPAGANSLLAGCFYAATLLCWTVWRQTGQRGWYATSLVAFALTLCSKDDAISLPIALLFLDYGLRPNTVLSDRFKSFLPVALLTALYIPCDIIGYHHAVLSNPKAALFAFDPARRLNILSHFLYQAFVTSGIDVVPLAPLGILIFFGALVFTGWKTKRYPLLMALLGIALIASLPAPLGTGMHSASGRFFFIPALMVSLMLGVYLDQMMRSQSTQTRIAAAAIIVGYLTSTIVAWRIDDPATIWSILFLTVSVAGVLWRAKVIDTYLAVLILIATLLSQLFYFIDPNIASFALPILIITVGGLMSRKVGGWQSILVMCVLMYAPYLSMPMFLVLATFASKFRLHPLEDTQGTETVQEGLKRAAA